MNIRIKRKFKSFKYSINDQICKVFIEPVGFDKNGCYVWNVGVGISSSNRELNDWYWNRKNKRAKSMRLNLPGKGGFKSARCAFFSILKARWHIPAGDMIVWNCESVEPDKQFKATMRWVKNHKDIFVNHERREFWWHRPPCFDDPIWKNYEIIGKTPNFPCESTSNDNYFKCFDTFEKIKRSEIEKIDIQRISIPKF